jgi:hypothetical protein
VTTSAGCRSTTAPCSRHDGTLMDAAEAHAQRAFELLGKADAVIANLLRDPTDQVARVQPQQWQRELEDLDLPVPVDHMRPPEQ